MFVKDMVREAKNGSNEALKELEVYYLDIFKNNVKRFCGEEYIEEAMYDYSYLIEEYFNSDYVEHLESFLRRKAKLYPKEKFIKRQLGDKIDFNNEDELNFIINHYTDSFFKKVKWCTDVLSEDDLFAYSLNLIKYFVFNLEINNDFRVFLNDRIHREIENYDNNEELLLKKYIIFNGYDKKIINYFSNKYIYILNSYINNYGYNFIKKEFKNIIEESLQQLNNSNNSLEQMIEKNIVKRIKEEKEKQKEYILKARNGSGVAFGILCNNYSYIINVMYDKYKDSVDLKKNDLKNIIKEKYDEYIYAYVNGTSNTDINKYLSTRLNDYMRNDLFKHVYSGSIVDEDNLHLKLIENEFDRILDCVPRDEAQKELEEACLTLLRKREYSKRANSNLKSSLNTCIKNRINKINKRYTDDSLENVKVKHPIKK